MVGVVPHLSGKIEGGRESHLSGRQKLTEPLVGLLCGSEPGILAHRPQPGRVHVRIRPPSEREFARASKIPDGITGPVLGPVGWLRFHKAGWETAPLVLTATRRNVSATKPTSSRDPMTSGVRWWSFSGMMSRIRLTPSVAEPSACSARNAMGLASYMSRSFPRGFFVSAG